MRYFDEETFAFLDDLAHHNDRTWFKENKERYDRAVKEPFLQFIADAGPALHKLSRNLVADPSPTGGSMFRIHRDIRFSKDKRPYKTYAGAHFQLGGKGVHGPGYYLHLQPGGSFIAGGMWMPEPEVLHRVRERIAARPSDWRRVRETLDDPEDALKRPPRGFDPDHPMIEDIKRKSFTSSERLSESELTGPRAMQAYVRSCTEIAPLMRFLAAAAGVRW